MIGWLRANEMFVADDDARRWLHSIHRRTLIEIYFGCIKYIMKKSAAFPLRVLCLSNVQKPLYVYTKNLSLKASKDISFASFKIICEQISTSTMWYYENSRALPLCFVWWNLSIQAFSYRQIIYHVTHIRLQTFETFLLRCFNENASSSHADDATRMILLTDKYFRVDETCWCWFRASLSYASKCLCRRHHFFHH